MSSPTIKTTGIVLSHVKYGEGSIVVTIYTEHLGRQAYIVNGVRSSKRKDLLPLMLPLSVIDMEAYNKPRTTLQRIKELKIKYPFASIPFDPARRAISMFITELLTKAIRDDGPDQRLFDFIMHSVTALDEGIPGQHNFHLYFMYKLTTLLGFEPDTAMAHEPLFDMLNGVYVSRQPLHTHVIGGADKELWTMIASARLDDLDTLPLSQDGRQRLIAMLEEYYTLHIPSFGGLKSHQVLHQLF